ncbi:MAG: hypothetical protein ACKVKM_08555 [Verrucomicrobiia bacterium]
MKIANVFGTIALAASLSGCAGLEQSRTFSPQEGDLVFQALSLEVDLVVAIEGVTESNYSHVGVLHKRDGAWTVIEATGAGVIYTPFEKWKSVSRKGRWAAFRVNAAHRGHVPKFLANLHPHAGKPYVFKYDLGQ